MAELLLVDDEIPVRLALRSLGDWASCGIQQVWEATNGREALTLLEDHPAIEVLITDIKMPIMDGIELMTHARALRPGLIILALSAFDDYDLIREAFRRGATDYILKPRLEPDEVVEQVRGLLASRPAAVAAGAPGPAEPADETRRWLRALAEASDLGSVAPPAPASLRLPSKNLSVLSLWIDDFQRVKVRFLDHSLAAFQAQVEDVLLRFLAPRPGALHVAISPQEYLLFVPWSTTTWTFEARHLAQELAHLFRHFLEVRVSLGVSSPADPSKTLPMALREARALVQLRHLLGVGRLILPQDARDLVLHAEGVPSLDTSLFADQVAGGDFPGARATWALLVTELLAYRLAHLDPYRQAARPLVHRLLEALSAAGIDAADALGADRSPWAELEGIEGLADLKAWLTEVGQACLAALEARRQLVTSHHVLRARRYLDAQYSDPELSLEAVARHVGLSRTYLSSLFEKETGTGYSEYLNGLRIREARRLLKTSSLKIYEIGERCGFNSVEYFSRLFRRVVGMTPAAYRDSKA